MPFQGHRLVMRETKTLQNLNHSKMTRNYHIYKTLLLKNSNIRQSNVYNAFRDPSLDTYDVFL